MAANLNVDGLNYLGPTRDMVQLGSDRSTLGPMLEAILKERGRTLGRDLHPERGYFFRSDHFPFAKARRAGAVASPSRRSSPARTPRRC